MADGTVGYTEGSGKNVGVDDLGAAGLLQRIKIVKGASGVDGGNIDDSNPFPTTDSLAQAKLDTIIAALASLLAELNAKTEPANQQHTIVDSSALPTGAATEATLATRAADATLTGGTAKSIARGGAKGATAAADLTGTAQGADHQALDVQIYHAGAAKDPTQVRALTSSDVVTAAQGTAAATAGAWPTKVTDGTNVQAVKAASTAAAATDPSAVVQISPNQPQLTTPLNIQGGKTNNNAAPGATNVGVLGAVANAAAPSYTEANLVAPTVDLAGALRVVFRPDVVLGAYSLGGSVSYTATTAGGIVFSFRWGDATRKCRIARVTVQVVATAFTTAGLVERQMVFMRSFTASDTGGTAVTPAANQNELQTAFGTSLLTDARFGGFLTAGTGTADTNPIATVSGWMAAVGNVIGGSNLVPLYEHKPGKKPLVFAQNEGFRIRLNAAETASTRMTYVNVEWDEGNNFE